MPEPTVNTRSMLLIGGPHDGCSVMVDEHVRVLRIPDNGRILEYRVVVIERHIWCHPPDAPVCIMVCETVRPSELPDLINKHRGELYSAGKREKRDSQWPQPSKP